MIKVVGSNDSGKTKKLLRECADVNGIFVCKHPERISEKCLAYGIRLVEAVGYSDLEFVQDIDNKEIFIDELDEFIKEVYPSVAGYSLTVED